MDKSFTLNQTKRSKKFSPTSICVFLDSFSHTVIEESQDKYKKPIKSTESN
jgi:hypothetical protein